MGPEKCGSAGALQDAPQLPLSAPFTPKSPHNGHQLSVNPLAQSLHPGQALHALPAPLRTSPNPSLSVVASTQHTLAHPHLPTRPTCTNSAHTSELLAGATMCGAKRGASEIGSGRGVVAARICHLTCGYVFWSGWSGQTADPHPCMCTGMSLLLLSVTIYIRYR